MIMVTAPAPAALVKATVIELPARGDVAALKTFLVSNSLYVHSVDEVMTRTVYTDCVKRGGCGMPGSKWLEGVCRDRERFFFGSFGIFITPPLTHRTGRHDASSHCR